MPLKPFLLVFDNYSLTRKVLLDFFDTRPEIKNWFAFLPAATAIISDRDAHQLSEIFRQTFPNIFFMITEIPPGLNNGWLDMKLWNFINNPISSGRWPPFS